MIRRHFTLLTGAALLAGVLAATLMNAAPAAAQTKKVVIAIPGVPPIYSVIIAYVAEKQGFFKKHGADVEIRPFDNGTAAARAVVAGDIDLAWSPTPPPAGCWPPSPTRSLRPAPAGSLPAPPPTGSGSRSRISAP